MTSLVSFFFIYGNETNKQKLDIMSRINLITKLSDSIQAIRLLLADFFSFLLESVVYQMMDLYLTTYMVCLTVSQTINCGKIEEKKSVTMNLRVELLSPICAIITCDTAAAAIVANCHIIICFGDTLSNDHEN